MQKRTTDKRIVQVFDNMLIEGLAFDPDDAPAERASVSEGRLRELAQDWESDAAGIQLTNRSGSEYVSGQADAMKRCAADLRKRLGERQ